MGSEMCIRDREKGVGVFVRDIKGLLESVSVDNRGAFERFYNLYYDQVFSLRLLLFRREGGMP